MVTKQQKKQPVISIVGRPNVGKSTLVNRLAGKRICIVGEKAGITRDRNYIDVEWADTPFTLIDTGGLDFASKETVDITDASINHQQKEYGFIQEILDQTSAGISEADAIIFVVDGTAGITKNDHEIAQFLRKNADIPIYLAVNKVDSPEREKLLYDFYELGFENLYPISAMHGSQGLSELLEQMLGNLNAANNEDEDEAQTKIKLSFIGKPNVGKSSLFNKLVGTERSIVSEVSGTTRDSINIKLNRHDHQFELIDTAGLRKKSKVKGDIERHSNLRAVDSIESCDVAVLIIDATADETVTEQDQRIANLIADKGRACVVLINKWDIFELKDEPKALKKFKNELGYRLRFIDYAAKEYISALTGQRTDKVWELAIAAVQEHRRRISTSVLNQVIADITTFHPAPIVKQKSIKIKYATQVGSAPPQFLLFTNYPELVPENYKRFLEKQLREYFGFDGTPIRLIFKKQEDK